MRDTSQTKGFVRVYATQGYLSGEMIRILLESRGIPTMVTQESVGATYGLTVGSLGTVEVYIPADRAEEAQAILQAMEEGLLETEAQDFIEQSRASYKNNKFRRNEILKDLGI